MVDNLLLRDYNTLTLEERVRAIEAAEQVAKTLVNRDIARIEEEKEKDNIDIGAIYITPRQCVELLVQELGADVPEVQSLLRRDEEALRLDPRVITMQETWKGEKLDYLDRYWWWDWEDESNVPLTKEQLRVARSLAYLYGHNWAWALAGRPPGRGMHAKRPPLLTAGDIYRYTVSVLVEDDYGTYAPELIEGNVVHVTGDRKSVV